MKIGLTTAQKILRECGLFSGLTDAELEKVAGLVTEVEYEPGAVIFNEGQGAEELFIVQEGKVALQVLLHKPQAPPNRKLTIDIITKNEMLGWSAIVEPYVYKFSAMCLQHVKALSIKGAQLRWVLQDNPKVGYEILKGLVTVVSSRLDETRQLLTSERSSST